MIRILYRNENGDLISNLPVDQLKEMIQKQVGLFWVDFDQEPAGIVESILNEAFDFHPLAVDDALHESHVPKVDDWQNYLFVVLHSIVYSSGDSERLKVPELDVFLGQTYLVTYHEAPIFALDEVWTLCQKDQRWLQFGGGRLFYRLIDQMVDEAISSEERMRDDLDNLEDQIFTEAGPECLEQLFILKRNILQVRRIVVPSRDVLNKLSRNNYSVISDNDRLFFRDVYDHFMQLETLLEDFVILVSGALDAYLSVVNNRMNDIMKTLTVITAFFMPLAFITGFFGMNFFQSTATMQTWTGEVAFIGVIVLMVLIPIIMFWWARRRSWI